MERLDRLALFVTTLLFASSAAQAQCAADAFEPNDHSGAATVLPLGSTTGLTASGQDEDWWVVQGVPAGHRVSVDVLFTSWPGSPDGIEVRLYGPAGGGQIDVGQTLTADEHVSLGNESAVAEDFLVQVYAFSPNVGCFGYDLVVSTAPDPCRAPVVDDGFEENDSCAAAVPLGAGVHTGLFVNDLDEDFYVLTVPPSYRVTIDQTYDPGLAELRLWLYDDPNCSSAADTASWGEGSNSVSFANAATVAAQDVYLRVVSDQEGCNLYDLNVAIANDVCVSAGVDDAFEDNDGCASAAPLGIGFHAGLFVRSADQDYYAITVPPGQQLTLDLTEYAPVALDMDLYDSSVCSSALPGVEWVYGPGGGRDAASWANPGPAPVTAYLRLRVLESTGWCSDYDLAVGLAPDPCQLVGLDDGFEDNESCATAPAMPDGTYTDLFVRKGDEDFFAVDVEAGDSLTVDVLFSHAQANVNVVLHDSQACGAVWPNVASSSSSDDDEQIVHTNLTGVAQTYYVRVYVHSQSAGDCADYSLSIDGGSTLLATPFCFGDGTTDVGGGPVQCPCGNNSALGAGEGCKSSLGYGAILTAGGTASVANDDLTFTISQARPHQPCLVVQGATTIAVAFKDGVLCVGNPTERLEVVILDANGSGSTAGSIVGSGHVVPGDVRHYQAWYRDPSTPGPCTARSNFTQGLSVAWN